MAADVNNIKRLVREDFPEEYQDLIDKLAYSLNPFMEQVSSGFDNQIDMSNLDQQIITINDVVVDGSQLPTKKLEFAYNLNDTLQGSTVISAINTTSASSYVTTAPYATIQIIQQGLAEVKHITGLIPGNKYTIKLLLVTN